MLVAPDARAHHEEPDRRLVVNPVLNALQPPVVPAQVLRGNVHGRLAAEADGPEWLGRADVLVAPGADQQLGLRPRRRGAGVLRPPAKELEAFMYQVVVPAGDEIGRRLDLAVTVAQAVAPPEFVERGVLDDLPIEGQVYDVVQRRDDGQAPVQLVGVHQAARAPLHRAPSHIDEVERDVELEGAIHVEVAEVVLLAGNRHQCPQVAAAERRREGLRKAEVGDAERPDGAVAPGLGAEPLVGIVAIFGLVDVRLPGAVGVVPSAAVLHGDGIAALDKRHRPRQIAVPLIVVDRAEQERRKRAGCVGQVDVGGEQYPVAHWYLDIETRPERLCRLCRMELTHRLLTSTSLIRSIL